MPFQSSKDAFGRTIPAAKTPATPKPQKSGPPRDLRQQNLKRKVKPIALPGKSRGR